MPSSCALCKLSSIEPDSLTLESSDLIGAENKIQIGDHKADLEKKKRKEKKRKDKEIKKRDSESETDQRSAEMTF